MTRKIFLVLVLVLCMASAAFAKPLKLGESYTVNIPDSFMAGSFTEKDAEEGQTGYYLSEETLLDFDVYQIRKTKEADTLEKFTAEDAAEVRGVDIKSTKINGIPVTSYRSIQENEGKEYPVLTYVFEDKDSCIKIDFWLDGENAETEANAIINTLSK